MSTTPNTRAPRRTAAPRPPKPTSGLPTARGFLPPGTPGHVCVGYNRACKTVRIAMAGLARGCTADLTDNTLDTLAYLAGVRPPGSEQTRTAVRSALAEPLTGDDCNQDIAQAVTDAAETGRPMPYRTADGRLMLLVPIPVPAHPGTP